MSGVRFVESIQSLLEPIDSVQQFPDNPRNGDIDKIIESIQVNGFYAPILVQRSTGYILAGNHRYHALLALGETQVPVIRVDVDDEKARRMLIADNATSDAAQNDAAQLAALLRDLQDTELGLTGTGFDQDDFQRLLLDVAPDPMPEGHGFGARGGLGIFQVVLEFEDEEDMEAAAAHMEEIGYNNVREVRL